VVQLPGNKPFFQIVDEEIAEFILQKVIFYIVFNFACQIYQLFCFDIDAAPREYHVQMVVGIFLFAKSMDDAYYAWFYPEFAFHPVLEGIGRGT